MTIKEQLKSIDDRIYNLKALLNSTDFKAIKYAEGLITESDYAPIKAQRQAYRDEINELLIQRQALKQSLKK